jgi:hypothetical protein
MKPHEERVVKEKEELDEKLSKLRLFFTSETFGEVNANEQARLKRQEEAMNTYSEILGERIAAF